MTLEMNHYLEQGVMVVTAEGDINSATASVFGDHLSNAVDDAPNAQLVLDMSKVFYMSSAGLRDIVATLKKAKKQDGDLRLAGIRDRLKPVFDMVGLNDPTFFYQTVDDAVASYD